MTYAAEHRGVAKRDGTIKETRWEGVARGRRKLLAGLVVSPAASSSAACGRGEPGASHLVFLRLHPGASQPHPGRNRGAALHLQARPHRRRRWHRRNAWERISPSTARDPEQAPATHPALSAGLAYLHTTRGGLALTSRP